MHIIKGLFTYLSFCLCEAECRSLYVEQNKGEGGGGEGAESNSDKDRLWMRMYHYSGEQLHGMTVTSRRSSNSPPRRGGWRPPSNTMFLGFPRVSTPNRTSIVQPLLHSPPTGHADWQTPGPSIAIVCISCIRCGLIMWVSKRMIAIVMDLLLRLKTFSLVFSYLSSRSGLAEFCLLGI